MTDLQPAGPDLARQLLRQARADAKTRGTAPKDKRPKRRLLPRDGGRDPGLFGGILEQLAVAYDWKRPSAGGTVMAAWPMLMGEDADKAVPERYDADTRTLHLRPVSAAAGTWARLHSARITARLNDKVGADTIAHIRVLAPGAAPVQAPVVESAPIPAPPQTPPRRREQAPDGFHRALEAAAAGRARAAGDPDQVLRDRYFADARGALREPEPAFVDGAAALEAITPTGGNDSEQIRQAAIKRARDERAGRLPAVPTAFQRSA